MPLYSGMTDPGDHRLESRLLSTRRHPPRSGGLASGTYQAFRRIEDSSFFGRFRMSRLASQVRTRVGPREKKLVVDRILGRGEDWAGGGLL